MKLMKSTVQRIDEEELLKIMGDEAPVGVCIMQDGKFCSFNSNFPVATGYTADELIGRDSLEIVAPEDREMVRENTIKMLKGKFTSPYQFRVIHKDGSIVWIMAAVNSIQYRGRRAILGSYMEVTERKEMEEALKEREERYEELANSITNVFFAMDEHLRYTYWNKASEILTGIRAEDAIGKSLRQLFPDTPERRNSEKLYRNVLKTRQPQTFVNDFDIEGRHYTFEISAYPSRGGISVFVKDITERKQAEEKLKESEQKYRTILEEMGDGYFEVDLAGNATFVNDALSRLLGYSKEELMGMNYRAFRTKEDAKAVFKAYNRIYKTGEPLRDFLTETICKDGRHVLAETAILPIRNNKGEIIGFRGVHRDITERRKMEEALRQSEEKYRALFDSSVIGMFVLDAETMKMVMCNRAAAKMFGFSSVEEAIGINPVDFIVPEERDKDLEIIIKDMFEQDLRQTHEFRALTKDGRKGWISVTGARIMHEGRLAGLVSITNINRRKQAEEALRRSEERYRTILEEMEESYFESDLGGHFTFVNNSACRDLGYSREELIGRSYKGHTAEDDIESVLRVYNEVYRTGVPNKGFPGKIIRKDGSQRFIETSLSPLRNDRDDIIGFRGVGRDVTERKQAEEKLKESEQKYRLLFETSLDCISQIDKEGRYLTANPATAKSLGVPLEELVGKTVFEVMPHEVAQYRLEMVRKALDEWQPQIFEDERAGRYFQHIYIPTKVPDQKEAVQAIARDITERRKMEEALRQGEEKYKALFDSLVIGTIVLDAETMKIVMVNKAAAKMFGFGSVEEALGVDGLAFILPEDKERVLELAMKHLFEDDSQQVYELETMTKDGRKIWINATGTRIMHEGKLAGLISFTDITERKNMEKALELQRNYFQQLFDNSPDAIIRVDIDDRVVQANKGFEALFGYPAEEINGRTISELVIPEGYREEASASARTLLDGEVARKELVRRCKDGRLIDVSAVSYPVRFDGKLVGAYVIYSDITERKQAEEALRQSEERYRTMLEEMEDAYFEVDLGGHLTFVNNATCRSLGYSREELMGMSYKGFTVEDDIESVFRVFNEVYRTGKPNKSCLWRTVSKDGTHRSVEHSAFPLRNDKGEIIGFRGIGRDITERKQTEEKLRQSEENYKTLFDSSVIGMYVLDAETMKVVMGNQASREMVGLKSVQEGIGINPFDFVVPEDREKVLEIAINQFLQDSRQTHEVRIIDKNGRRRWQGFSSARIMHQGRLASLVSIMDITERKLAEEKLRQSEENYKTLFDSSVIGTLVLDAETMKVVMANQAAAKMFGFSSAEEGIGLNPVDFVPPEDRERVLEVIRKDLFEQDLRQTHEFRAITKDGRELWISVTAARIVHEGKLAGLICFTDITERKQAEDKLQQSRENYRALFDSSVIGALVVDAETMKVVMANEATLKMFGFSFPETGVNPFDFIPPEDRQKNLELVVNEVFGKDSRKSIDIPAVTKDGRKIWVSVTGARIMQKGKLAGLFSFTDITERKQAEEALQQSEENYRALFDSSVIGTVLLDAETMKIAMANKAAVKLFGFSSEKEVLGIDPFAFVLPEDREGYIEIATKALFEQNSSEPFEIRAVGKDGREKWINATATVITYKGKLTGLISFADITEQKQQRERLMMTDRLASLGELASGTAHELNNPLTSIIGFSQLLMEREVPDDIREDLKLINNEAQRAANVTKNLLTFARKHAPEKQRNQINNIIEDVLKLRAYEHKVNAIEVERQLDPDLPEIMVDYFQMQQVLMNIVINAEYFMTKAHSKGTLTITTKKRNDTVIISIADDGPGISPENLRRIFDPFFTTKEAGKGTGLGLSICHGIVTEHVGQIYARSQLGKGTTFFVELPINGS